METSRLFKPLVVALLLTLGPVAAQACEIGEGPEGWIDPPIRVARDCSFEDAGEYYGIDVSGSPAVDIGNGRIGQRIGALGGCGPSEDIIVVDCNSGEGIQISGQPYGDDIQGGTDVDALYPPQGALRLTADATIAALAALSDREGYRYRLDLTAFLSDYIGGDLPDLSCGCRIFYPGSPGLSQ